MTTSGASTSLAKRPAGTRKCAQTTSGRGAACTALPQLEEPPLAARAPVEHRQVDVVPALAQRAHAERDERAEVGVARPGIHLRDEQDPHGLVGRSGVAAGRTRPTPRAGRCRSRRSCSGRRVRRASGGAGCRCRRRPRGRARGPPRRPPGSARRGPRRCVRVWRRSPSGSILCSSIGASVSAANRLTPTITRSPDSTSRCQR